jgi:hypothetical protein
MIRHVHHEHAMLLLPRSWRISRVRSVVTGLAWLFVLTGLYGACREACSTAGWGSYILIGLGSLVVALLAATEDGMSWSGRAL